MKTDKHCCCQHKPDDTSVVSEPPLNQGMIFKIDGLDCVEEVSILKSEIGDLVGGEDQLAFDVINGRMSVLSTPNTVNEKAIIKAVAATGMKATRWQAGNQPTDIHQHQRSQTLYATLSGLSIVVGILIHIALAGGFTDIQQLIQEPEQWSYSWQAVIDYLTGLLNSHRPQSIPPAEKLAYALAISLGLRHVIVKAWYALKRLRADMNLLMLVAIIGAMFINEWFEAAAVSFLFSVSLAIESWSIGRARHAI